MRHYVLVGVMLVSMMSAGEELPALRPGGLNYRDPRTVTGPVEVRQVAPLPGKPQASQVLSVDLSSQMPPVKDQGTQGSCVGFALGYYYKTHTEWLEHGWNVNDQQHQFSPAFIYNQVNGGADQGAYFDDAMTLMNTQGVCNWADFPYSSSNYTNWPSESAYSHAIPFRGEGTYWIDVSNAGGLDAIKQRLNNGYTTVLGINIWGNFDDIGGYSNTYCVADKFGTNRAGHAVTIVGYDDTRSTHDGTGAFKLVNSWGTGWGASGYFWMSYTAVMNGDLSQLWAFYDGDRIGYQPTMLGRVRLTHSGREKVGIRMGVGPRDAPFWTQDFRTWRYAITDRSFPSNNMVFDMTDGEPYISSGATDSVFVRCIDDVSDGKTGTINYYVCQHLLGGTTAVSADPPVSIPDVGVAVSARAAFSRSTDVGVAEVLSPLGTIDSGVSVTPQVKVRSYGSSSVSFSATMRIGAVYSNTQSVSNLPAHDSAVVSFGSWAASPAGQIVVRCSTALSGDQFPGNDAKTDTVAVRTRHDVAVLRVIAPAGSIDSGSSVQPRARVRNLGLGPTTFPVVLKVGAFYVDTKTVSGLPPGDSTDVVFATWTASQVGTHAVACSTALVGDEDAGNDTASASVTVEVFRDVGLLRIIAPTGQVDSGTTVIPSAVVRNWGQSCASFPVTLLIGTDYQNQQSVVDLPPGDSETVAFAQWTVVQKGPLLVACSTSLAGDLHPDNDRGESDVLVRWSGWLRVLTDTAFDLFGVSCPNSSRVAFTVGSCGSIIKTSNGGASWRTQQSGVTRTLRGVCFPTDAMTGFAVGDTGVVLKTTDGGTTWVSQNSGTAQDLYAVHFPLSPQTGYAAGNGGVVTKTTNGGALWTVLSTGVTEHLRSVQFLTDNQTGRACGLGRRVLATSDGGANWSARTSSLNNNYAICYPVDTLTGFLAGRDPTFAEVCRSVGGGPWFTRYFSGNDAGLYSLVFTDPATGYAAGWHSRGGGAAVIKSTDGGQSWHESFLGIPDWLYACDFASDKLSGYAAGDNGTIVRTMYGGGLRYDVGVRAILAPRDTVDSGSVVVPQAKVWNYGGTVATFAVTMRIGGGYSDAKPITDLAPGESAVVSFAEWVACPSGLVTTRCSTAFGGDQNGANDRVVDSVRVVHRPCDVGVSRIVSPLGIVDSGSTVTPIAVVRNFGTSPAQFAVRFAVDTFHVDTQAVELLLPGDSAEVEFRAWQAAQRGPFASACSTMAAGDTAADNNAVRSLVTVRWTSWTTIGARQVPLGGHAIAFPADQEEGYILSSSGVDHLFRTRDGGASWQPISMPSGTWNDLAFPSGLDTGYVVGFNGRILKTTDRGGSWLTLTSGTPNHLECVCFPSGTLVGYAAGYYGTIVRTTDGGATWWLCNSGSTANINALAFCSSATGYACGDGGTLLKTTDAGLSWSPLDVGVSEPFWGLSFPHEADTGYVAGGGVVAKTVDGGMSWIRSSLGFGVYSVYFPTDVARGFAYGGHNSMLRTTNGGESWVCRSWGTDRAVFDVTFPQGLMTGYGCGDHVVLKTIDGGGATTDAGVRDFAAPLDTVALGTDVFPRVVFKNYSDTAVTFAATLRIGSSYLADTVVAVDPGLSDTVTFPGWLPDSLGVVVLRCSLAVAGDMWPPNDTLSASTVVVPLTGIAAKTVLPREFALGHCRPNPSTWRTEVAYSVPAVSFVDIRICDPCGRTVWVLRSGRAEPGFYRATWDGSQSDGSEAVSGVYYCVMRTECFRAVQKVLLVRK